MLGQSTDQIINNTQDAGPHRRLRVLPLVGWLFLAASVSVWAASLVPFYANGLHLASDLALEYAGGGYAAYNIPYAPMPEDVYGTSVLGGIAQSVVCFGPCIFFLVFVGVAFRLISSWYSYSQRGITLRIAAVFVILVLVVLSTHMSGKFLIWGLG